MITADDLRIFYEDKEILVCLKPAGLPVETARAGQMDLVSLLKTYRIRKGEEAYIGPVHRLDQPVSGVMVFAKTGSAAATLSAQLRRHQVTKEYLALLSTLPKALPLESQGQLTHYLLRNGKTNTSAVVKKDTPGAKNASLSYKILNQNEDTGETLVRIWLHTGRHHQIRVQFAHIGHPLVADTKYGQSLPKGEYRPIALCSARLAFAHPKTGKQMDFSLAHEEIPFLSQG